MGKEIKIGLSVIGLLLCVFAGVLFMRLRREQPHAAQAKVAAAKKAGKLTGGKGQLRQTQKSLTKNQQKAGPALGLGLQEPTAQRYGGEASTYRNRPPAGRYGRDDASDDVPETRAGELPADEGANVLGQLPPDESANALGDVPAPTDRFAQAAPSDRFAAAESVGIAFSADEAAEEPEEANGGQERAARDLSMNAPADTLAPLGQNQEDAADEPVETASSDAAAPRLAPLNADALEFRPAANDRYSRRHGAPPAGAGAALIGEEPAAELVDDANPDATKPFDEEARPLQGREGESFTVGPNDNFWSISQKVYGTGAYFKALEEHNRPQYGDKPLLQVGDVVSAPPIEELRKNHPALAPQPRGAPSSRTAAHVRSVARGEGGGGGNAYTVAEGDTLFDIARRKLGKASRWAEIYELNREQLGEDFNFLSPGTQLTMPEGGEKANPIATRPARDNYRR